MKEDAGQHGKIKSENANGAELNLNRKKEIKSFVVKVALNAITIK